ncbi:MAG: HAD family hydrolase [Candidatus Lokiarchaeota archaeon]|nr:HAD family hydrolase [Candidatus Lokiarchaeota archaeon]
MDKSLLKAIIWDLDGTLIQFNIDVLRARKITIEIFEDFGIPKGYLTIKDNIRENIIIAKEYFKRNKLKSLDLKNVIEKIDSEVIRIEYEAAKNATKIKDIDKVLEFVRKKNLKQVIFTFNTYHNTILSLRNANLYNYFDLIVGRDNVKNPKPHKDHLSYICKKLNILPSEILIIGDTSSDIESALRIGAKSIAINNDTPNFYKKDLFQYANLIVEQINIPDELINAIKSFF